MLEFVTIQKHAKDTGYSVAALRSKIQRGDLLKGIHWIKSPDGRIQINVKAYQAWVRGERLELNQEEARSE